MPRTFFTLGPALSITWGVAGVAAHDDPCSLFQDPSLVMLQTQLAPRGTSWCLCSVSLM